MATQLSQNVTFNEINVTGCDSLVDVTHELGEPCILVSFDFVSKCCIFLVFCYVFLMLFCN